MSVKLHRVAIAVKDLDKAIATYEKLTGAKFHKTDEALAKVAGVRVALAFDYGFELVAVNPGSDTPATKAMEKFLKEHGEGIFAIGCVTDDMDASSNIAKSMGIEVLYPRWKLSGEECQRDFHGACKSIEEEALDTRPQLGYILALTVFE